MENVVEVKNLVKRYKERVALDHLNLEIRKGEIFGLLGPNGSGKTTAINCILSLLQYDKGEINVMGRPMDGNTSDRKRKIGVVMQNVAVFDELTVYENIDYFCGLYIEEKQKRKQCVEEAIEFVGLSEFRKYYPKKLSGGLLRRLNIACGIAHKPELIFFDEPTVAVDPQSRNKILEGIVMLNKQEATVIYTSHYMEEVEQICSRIAILDRGKVLAQGTADELKAMIKNTETIRLEVPQIAEETLKKLYDLPHIYQGKYEEGMVTLQCSGGSDNLLKVLHLLEDEKVSLGRIYSERPTLNDVFLEITGKTLRDEEPK